MSKSEEEIYTQFILELNSIDNFHCLSLIGIYRPKKHTLYKTECHCILASGDHCHHFRCSNEKCIFRFVLLSKWKAWELCLYCMKRWPPSWFISRQIINKYVKGKIDNWFVSFKTANVPEKSSFRLQKCIFSYSLRSMCPVGVLYTMHMSNIWGDIQTKKKYLHY